jgi:polyphosphate kinase
MPKTKGETTHCIRYFNRELSLLDFQQRVLEEAQDERNPLLERLKFLAIFGSNMDEFLWCVSLASASRSRHRSRSFRPTV